jgi:hypothetical protein
LLSDAHVALDPKPASIMAKIRRQERDVRFMILPILQST